MLVFFPSLAWWTGDTSETWWSRPTHERVNLELKWKTVNQSRDLLEARHRGVGGPVRSAGQGGKGTRSRPVCSQDGGLSSLTLSAVPAVYPGMFLCLFKGLFPAFCSVNSLTSFSKNYFQLLPTLDLLPFLQQARHTRFLGP